MESLTIGKVKLTKACSGKGPVTECPILEVLEK